jgi:hypothetical protein
MGFHPGKPLTVMRCYRGPTWAGVAQLAERQPSKLNVAGSIPVSRSTRRPSPVGQTSPT